MEELCGASGGELPNTEKIDEVLDRLFGLWGHLQKLTTAASIEYRRTMQLGRAAGRQFVIHEPKDALDTVKLTDPSMILSIGAYCGGAPGEDPSFGLEGSCLPKAASLADSPATMAKDKYSTPVVDKDEAAVEAGAREFSFSLEHRAPCLELDTCFAAGHPVTVADMDMHAFSCYKERPFTCVELGTTLFGKDLPASGKASSPSQACMPKGPLPSAENSPYFEVPIQAPAAHPAPAGAQQFGFPNALLQAEAPEKCSTPIQKDGAKPSLNPWASFLSGITARGTSPTPCRATNASRGPAPHRQPAPLPSPHAVPPFGFQQSTTKAHRRPGAVARPVSASPPQAAAAGRNEATSSLCLERISSRLSTANAGSQPEVPATEGGFGAHELSRRSAEFSLKISKTSTCGCSAGQATSPASNVTSDAKDTAPGLAPTPWDISPRPCHAAAGNRGHLSCELPLERADTNARQPQASVPASPATEETLHAALTTAKDVEGPDAMPWTHFLRDTSARDTSPGPAYIAASWSHKPEADELPKAPATPQPVPGTAAPSAAAPLLLELGCPSQDHSYEGLSCPEPVPASPAPAIDAAVPLKIALARPNFPPHLLETHLAASKPEVGPAPPASIAPVVELPPIEVVSKYDKKSSKKRGLARAVSAIKGAVPRAARRAAKACRKGLGRLACLSGGSGPAVVGAPEQWVLPTKVDRAVLREIQQDIAEQRACRGRGSCPAGDAAEEWVLPAQCGKADEAVMKEMELDMLERALELSLMAPQSLRIADEEVLREVVGCHELELALQLSLMPSHEPGVRSSSSCELQRAIALSLREF